jgi:pilus assembly protein CpaC
LLGFAQEEALDKAEAGPEDIDVEVGIDRFEKLDFEFDTRIQINDTNLVKVTAIPSKKEILIRGYKVGRTSVVVFDTRGERRKNWVVNVKATGPSKVAADLREFLGDIEGLDINVKAGQVVLEGEIVVPSDLGRISVILVKYPDVINLINLSPQTQRIIARKMQREIQNAGLKDVTVRIVNGIYWLEGVVSKEDDRKLAMRIAEGYIIAKVSSLSSGSDRVSEVSRKPIEEFLAINAKKETPPPEKLIKVSSQFVELQKDYTKQFGFRWMPLLDQGGGSITLGKTTEGGLTTQGQGTLTGVIKNLFPKLVTLKQAGYARIIQSAMIITRDKQPASIDKTQNQSFVVGGGTGIAPPATQQASTTYKMQVTPEALEGEKINLDISMSVNVPAGSGVSNQPLVTQNNINTKVVVKSKESAVIGGVVLNETKTAFDKSAPGALQQSGQTGGSQALFNFQRSKDYSSLKSQFVIFVTPEIIESAFADTEDVRRKFRRRGR